MSAGRPIGTPGSAASRTSSAGRHSRHSGGALAPAAGALGGQGQVQGASRHRAEDVANVGQEIHPRHDGARRSPALTRDYARSPGSRGSGSPAAGSPVRHSGTIAIRRLSAVTQSVGLAATSATTSTLSPARCRPSRASRPATKRERRSPTREAHRERDRQQRGLGRAGLRDDQCQEVLPRRRARAPRSAGARRRRRPRPRTPPSSAWPQARYTTPRIGATLIAVAGTQNSHDRRSASTVSTAITRWTFRNAKLDRDGQEGDQGQGDEDVSAAQPPQARQQQDRPDRAERPRRRSRPVNGARTWASGGGYQYPKLASPGVAVGSYMEPPAANRAAARQ